MLDYKKFRKEMVRRGHKVAKKGIYVTIVPNNNYLGCGKGFLYFPDVIDGYENYFKLVAYDHYNTEIFSVKFKLI